MSMTRNQPGSVWVIWNVPTRVFLQNGSVGMSPLNCASATSQYVVGS